MLVMNSVSQFGELGTVTHHCSHLTYLFAATSNTPKRNFWGAPGLKSKPDLSIDQIIKSDANSLWNGLE